MKLPVLIRPEAEAEMAEAFDWYEDRVPGLGADFLLAVDAALNAIARNPKQFPSVHPEVRRALTRRFPYEIFFIAEEERVVVLAVFNAKREPKRWQDRV